MVQFFYEIKDLILILLVHSEKIIDTHFQGIGKTAHTINLNYLKTIIKLAIILCHQIFFSFDP
jgi:hypothetical protein